MSNVKGIALRIRGKVQGVGFRPLVCQLARQLKLSGDVCNDSAGVLIRLVCANPDVFIASLYENLPSMARIDSVEILYLHWDSLPRGFSICPSGSGSMQTEIVPDAATCPACLRELNDPINRRYRYPFINCTHCGPRFTLIRKMPYDRALTVMAAFPLCPSCNEEYHNPLNRRFHAQPVACNECGPQIFWQDGKLRLSEEHALRQAVAALKNGRIVAIMGLGGIHLAVDARNHQAVKRLRERKHRPAKPLAVMIPDTTGLPTAAISLLTTPSAPIVLVSSDCIKGLSSAIAPGLDETGVMLPANPLQHLLMQDFGGPLVMTSGNLSGGPPAITNYQALKGLKNIADGWLLHNRKVVQRMDDSVLRVSGEVIRRARGFVPDAWQMPPGFENIPPILALGGDSKNTFCLVRGKQAVLSQHFGNLTQDSSEMAWRTGLRRMCKLYDFTPEYIVTDAHPAYRSSQYGRDMALPVSEVHHHHAHAAACLAEHGWPLSRGDVIALTLDGVGYGADGQLWGGECLVMNYHNCNRLGGLPAVALPGGDLAARQPWRNLLAHCERFVPGWQIYPETSSVLKERWQPLAEAIKRRINSPSASSCGRLFDAAAAALNCTPPEQTYEGEAACRLEALAYKCEYVDHPVKMPLVEGQLDLETFWKLWLGWRGTINARAWAFHDALAKGFAELARHHAVTLGISTIVCSGGVLHNRVMRKRIKYYLQDFNVLLPMRLPAGDGALSLGQAVIAAASMTTYSKG